MGKKTFFQDITIEREKMFVWDDKREEILFQLM